jgi:hypothetical protein
MNQEDGWTFSHHVKSNRLAVNADRLGGSHNSIVAPGRRQLCALAPPKAGRLVPR